MIRPIFASIFEKKNVFFLNLILPIQFYTVQTL